ncbi:LuxS MPP-like metallohydrolase [Coniophora puteana RWD-64-598 SS2]|uniref:Cytochrome b-c1 complex subunit 2, mitochondrial n=1 Tax=Coniophora puteana (strain RWD-64-598) TaxID=741705 RepID=A0A5M3MBU5_CONPW|nr:LuxS MPP-like metallohydrolase [Coniophora puteana RWD-64-598 SS2]EIW76553.1 LuxS MPP-like metallohydrolase [Coniophora puteana RWD-64-598 SS2]
MLAARASAARNASRAARSFATVVDAQGVKLAAADNGQPTSAVTFLLKAGSRYETKPGAAHVLKNFAFRSAGSRSALGTVREAELYGGVLTSSLSREHIALTAEFLRGDEQIFVDLLASTLTSSKFLGHEFSEYVAPVVASESTLASVNPATRAIELAHSLAFRNGLGSPLFAPEHSDLTVDDVRAYAASAFAKGNLAVVGTGIDASTLQALLDKHLSGASAGAAASSPASSYFGGETRVDSHSGPQTVFIGYGVSGQPSPALSVLAAHLSTTPSVKWSKGLSPLAAALPEGASVQTVLFPYSDATLFGFLVQGATGQQVKEAAKAVTQALKDAKNVKGEDVKKAVAKAKFSAASALDARETIVEAVSQKIFSSSDLSAESALSALDKVNESELAKAVSSLTSAKPTYVAIGDIRSLPYSDEVGL